MKFSFSACRDWPSMSAACISIGARGVEGAERQLLLGLLPSSVTFGSDDDSVRISARTLTKASAASCSLRPRSAGVSAAASLPISAP